MIKRNYPYLRLTSQSIKGNYYGAYASTDENSTQGYTVFVSHTEGVRSYCECTGWSLKESCYHLSISRDLEERLFA